jgi:hypothetical protein
MNLFKTTAIAGALAVSMVSAPAFAQFQDWATWFGTPITVTDKTFTLVDFDANVTIQGTPQNPFGFRRTNTGGTYGANNIGTGATEDSTTAFAPGLVNIFENSAGNHQVNLTGPNGAEFPLSGANGSLYAIQYIVNIDPSSYPPENGQEAFGSVSLSLNATGQPNFGKFMISKRVQGLTPIAATGGVNPWVVDNDFDIGAVFDATLTTIDATPQTIFCGVCTRFLVTDYAVILNSSVATVLSQMTNTFQQVEVPAPAPIALLAAGLLGVGLVRRMKKA